MAEQPQNAGTEVNSRRYDHPTERRPRRRQRTGIRTTEAPDVDQFGAMVRPIARSDKTSIAAPNGAAAGVGLAFALTCDLAVAADDAVMVPAFSRLGLVPEVGTSWALTRALGYRRAFAYYVSGEHISAQRALELGLVNQLVSCGELMMPPSGGSTGSPRCHRTRWRSRSHSCAEQQTPAGPIADDGRARRADLLHDRRIRRECQQRGRRHIEHEALIAHERAGAAYRARRANRKMGRITASETAVAVALVCL